MNALQEAIISVPASKSNYQGHSSSFFFLVHFVSFSNKLIDFNMLLISSKYFFISLDILIKVKEETR